MAGEFARMPALAVNDANENAEATRVRREADEIAARHAALVDHACRRRQTLLDAAKLADEFAHSSTILREWLKEASAEVSALCRIVTSRDEIERNVERQRVRAKSVWRSFSNFSGCRLFKKMSTRDDPTLIVC